MGDLEGLLGIIKNITVWNIVDILIVAYIVYKVFMLIRETRAEQLVKGLIFMVIVMKLSDIFGLITLHWIIQNTFTVGLIALVIIFQPELRKALEHLGRSKILTRKFFEDDKEVEKVVDEITIAAVSMSSVKTGALMVIEQETGLNDFVENGVRIGALVSSALLENIFVENTPLHDGAVIIRRNKIVAAACVLPLTEQRVSKELGTRHRAAIGITENADCIALVVSEETGKISVVVDGRITRNYDAERLKNVLVKLLKRNVATDNTIYKKVRKWVKKIDNR